MAVQLLGFEIADNWRVSGGSVLGSGSFGIVVKATRISDSEVVALKIVACVSADGLSNSVTSTNKERLALTAIGYHPNIVQLKGWEELDPTHAEVALAGPLMQGINAWIRSQSKWDPSKGCMVPSRPMPGHMVSPGKTHKICIAALQLVGEMELYDHLIAHGLPDRLPAEFLRPVTQQLAKALQHVHLQGFGHFDLKLENIRIAFPPGTDPVVTLVDFGLAANIGDGEIPTKGSECILAPEFFSDIAKNVTVAADIFSFGIVLFTLAFGAPPWAKAKTIGELDGYERPCPMDAHGRGFQEYARPGDAGRLLAYAKQIPAFKGALSPPAPPAPVALPALPIAIGATVPTLPKEGSASPAPATGAPPPPPVLPTLVPAPSDPRLIDLLGKMLQIKPTKRPTAQEILEHDWITNPEPEEEPSFISCSAASDAEPQQFNNCGASDDAEPQPMSCGATAPTSAAYRSLGDTELVLPKLTRTHALVAIEEGWAFTEFPV